jgi:hypothetical protein
MVEKGVDDRVEQKGEDTLDEETPLTEGTALLVGSMEMCTPNQQAMPGFRAGVSFCSCLDSKLVDVDLTLPVGYGSVELDDAASQVHL